MMLPRSNAPSAPTRACPPPPPAWPAIGWVRRRWAGDDLYAPSARRQRIARIGDYGALDPAGRGGHDHQARDIFEADGEIHAREFAVLAISGPRLQLIPARRDVADVEAAVALDAPAGAALQESRPAPGLRAVGAREHHHPAPVRRAGRADHLSPHADQARGQQPERDATLLLRERHAHPLRLGGIRRPGEIRRSEPGQIVAGVGDLARAKHAADQVVAGSEPEEPIESLVVGRIAGARRGRAGVCRRRTHNATP